jgi:hypothetical protein
VTDKIIEAIANTPSDGGGKDVLEDILSPNELAFAADRVMKRSRTEGVALGRKA